MSTSVSESVEVKNVPPVPNGALASPASPERTAVPRFPFIAAPFAAVAASVLVMRIARRRRQQAAKPSVYWSFSVATGNHVNFRPTLAPRFSGFLVRGRGKPSPRRLVKR
jgi:hypothetical protein